MVEILSRKLSVAYKYNNRTNPGLGEVGDSWAHHQGAGGQDEREGS